MRNAARIRFGTHLAVLSLSLVASLALAAGASARSEWASDRSGVYAQREVIVRWRPDTDSARIRAAIRSIRGKIVARSSDGSALVRYRSALAPRDAAFKLRALRVASAASPNYRARASFVPNDPAFARQWHLSSQLGIGVPTAWDLARRARAPGGRGVRVAVVDTGVAYGNYRRCRCRRAPDLGTVERGYDFVDRDRYAYDFNGHGTHVAQTIVERTNNARAGAGIAYRARVLPVRVLDELGEGTAWEVAEGIRYAVRRKAKVVNLSVTLDSRDTGSGGIPELQAALSYAERNGVLVVAAAGNASSETVPLPASYPTVLAVGATTSHGCLASYSNYGGRLDLVAPGGGADAAPLATPWDQSHCRTGRAGADIYQETFLVPGRFDRFGLPRGYNGTSMAAAQVSGVAALVVASRVLGDNPTPAALRQWLQATARDIGAPGRDDRYGAGLLDAAAALTPRRP